MMNNNNSDLFNKDMNNLLTSGKIERGVLKSKKFIVIKPFEKKIIRFEFNHYHLHIKVN